MPDGMDALGTNFGQTKTYDNIYGQSSASTS